MAEYKDKNSFDEFFREMYVPLDYRSIREDMRAAAETGWDLFTEEYQQMHHLKKENYILYLTSDAYCNFEEIVEAAVDMLNPQVADAVMEISAGAGYDSSITELYFDTIDTTLKEMLDALFDDVLVKL